MFFKQKFDETFIDISLHIINETLQFFDIFLNIDVTLELSPIILKNANEIWDNQH